MPEKAVLLDTSARRDLYVFALLKFDILKKQHMYFFLPFGFINVIIFVINPSGSYSTFVEADLEYPNSLRYDKSS